MRSKDTEDPKSVDPINLTFRYETALGTTMWKFQSTEELLGYAREVTMENDALRRMVTG